MPWLAGWAAVVCGLEMHAWPNCVQVYDLEKRGGSVVAGVLALMRDKKANPPPPRDPRLPPKPAGQTVGSFRRGLTMLPEAIAANLSANIRRVLCSVCVLFRTCRLSRVVASPARLLAWWVHAWSHHALQSIMVSAPGACTPCTQDAVAAAGDRARA